jgi:hypothetical protein
MSVRTIGNIAMSFVAPDVLHMSWRGSFGEAEADGLLAYTRELKAKPDVKHVLLYIDVREAGSIDARARKKISELTKEKPYLASAIVGASFPIRVAVELIVNAAKLLVKDSAETRFFEDEASANAWLAEMRTTLI